MIVDCMTEDHRWEGVGLESIAETAAVAVLDRLGLEASAYEISVLGCNDPRIAELNEDFRGKPVPTNVLSWPSDERAARIAGEMPLLPGAAAGPVELGDIAIAYDICATEAQAAGRSMHDHVLHLMVHGTLHLLGFDHDRDADAALMEGLETEVLGKLGVADPYQPQD